MLGRLPPGSTSPAGRGPSRRPTCGAEPPALHELVLALLEECQREIERITEQQRQSLRALSAMRLQAAGTVKQLRACSSSAPPMATSVPNALPKVEDDSDGDFDENLYGRVLTMHDGRRSWGPLRPSFSESQGDNSSRGSCGEASDTDSEQKTVDAEELHGCWGMIAAQRPARKRASSLSLYHTEAPRDNELREGGHSRETHYEVQSLTEALAEDELAKQVFPQNKLQQCLLPVINSYVFQTFIGIMICVNALVLGIFVHCEASEWIEGNSADKDCIDHPMLEMFCMFVFRVELALRLIAEQREFVTGPNMSWNLFDSFVLIFSLVDIICGKGGVASVARMFRNLRMFRAIRVCRIFKFLLQLRLMLFSVLSCMAALVWAFVLLALVICMFAIYFETVAATYLEDGGKVSDDGHAILQQSWKGMPNAIRSLIYAISGGDDWGYLSQPFWEMGNVHGLIFMSYVLFITFGLLNILVGVFVQETDSLGRWDRDMVLHEALDKTSRTIETLQQVFDEMDVDQVGSITVPQLQRGLENGKTRAWFSHLDIEIGHDGQALIDFVELDNEGRLPKDKFVDTCRLLSGSAKPVIVARLGLHANATWELLSEVAEAVGVEKTIQRRPCEWSLLH